MAELAGLVEICRVSDPKVPSSAFVVKRSDPVQRDKDYWLKDYWMRYRCKEVCADWRQCQVPAYAQDDGDLMYHGRQPDLPKQSVAFVVDGMGGHLAYTTDGGDQTIFTHNGSGGIGYDPSVALLEKRSPVNTVTMSWAMGLRTARHSRPAVLSSRTLRTDADLVGLVHARFRRRGAGTQLEPARRGCNRLES